MAIIGTAILSVGVVCLWAGPQPQLEAASQASQHRAVLNKYCVACHNEKARIAGLMLDKLDVANVAERREVWEKVITKLRAGMMPPAGSPRPDEAALGALRSWIETEIDRAAIAQPNPGRTEAFHRMNRTEYQNAVRDLLDLNVDSSQFLPADDSSNGFDNMAGTLRISQSLMARYLAAAKTVSRMALGKVAGVDTKVYKIVPDLQQHVREEGLPFGTRGGTLVNHLFPRAGSYDIRVELTGAVRVTRPEQLEISVDGEQVKLFNLGPQPAGSPRAGAAGRLEARVPVTGGPHDVGVAFYKMPLDLLEQTREPFENPRTQGHDGGPGGALPSVVSVTVIGPYQDEGTGDSPSRRRILVCKPANPGEEPACAKTILAKLAHRAFRGPVAGEDLQVLLDFYNTGRKQGADFEAGIELALRRLLVSPSFLFRVETDPAGAAATGGGASVYRVNDLEFASRLSFFLWSSIPDEQLLNAAEQGKLRDAGVLAVQVRRMLADPRSAALTANFAGQWLQLRNLDQVRPGDPYSLTFEESLRLAMRRETELFFDSMIRANRPVMELLTANYTFLNERLAAHYGIPNVQGSDFRRVMLAENSPRRGLLGQGSILTITSQPNRTSPVLRGKWFLKNVLGTPPPDPPPNVPALPDRKTQAKVQTVRERLAAHRRNPACASCHNMIDPVGFALENFDAIGKWRTVDESFNVLDVSGALPDGTRFNGVNELRAALARHPERFVNTAAEKLLTYALGRGLEYYDMPAARKIVNDSTREQYKFQSIILGVVNSLPFQMRSTAASGSPPVVAGINRQ